MCTELLMKRSTSSLLHWVGLWFQEDLPSPELLPVSSGCSSSAATAPHTTRPTLTWGQTNRGAEDAKFHLTHRNQAHKEIFICIYRKREPNTKGTWPKTKCVLAQGSMRRNSSFIISISAAAIHLGNARIHLEAALICCTQLLSNEMLFCAVFPTPWIWLPSPPPI